jgi:hypothetical protein
MAFYCERVEPRGGTYDIIGVAEHITASGFPLVIPRLTFVAFVEASTSEGPDHTIAIRPIDEDFNVQGGYAEERISIAPPPEGVPYRAAVQFILRPHFAREGEFGIQVLADGQPIGVLSAGDASLTRSAESASTSGGILLTRTRIRP